jgi:hypothetical protein
MGEEQRRAPDREYWIEHTCMKAVAIMTPEPKYFATKNAIGGTCIFFALAAAIGSRTP